MFYFLISRLMSALLVTLGVVCLVFLLIHFVPGDPVDVMLGESAAIADVEALRKSLGLDLPIGVQLWNYLVHLAQLDLGESVYRQQPVIDILQERMPATAQLALAALFFSMLIAFPLGILSAIYKDHFLDRFAMGFSLFGVSIPSFWMGPMLILIFSLWLGWFPVSGRDGWASLVLPAITLGAAMAAILSRMIRSALLEILNEDFIRTARAKGLREIEVILFHGLPNAMLPVITILGLQLGVLLGGAVITETVFSWPGIGSLLIEAIQQRDYPVVQATVLVISLVYVTINLLTDILYAWIDPRIRTA